MNRLQSLRAEREFCVTLNRTQAIDPDRGDSRRSSYAHPVYTAAGVQAQRHIERDQRPAADPLLRRLLGLGLSRGRRAQRDAGRRTLRERGCDPTASASTRATIRHRRREPRREFEHRIALFYLDLDELPRLLGGRLLARAPGALRFRRRDYLGDRAVPLDCAGP